MRIPLIEVSKEGSVREVLQTGGIIGHDIHGPREEAARVTVAVELLVLTGVVAEVSGRAIVRDRSSVDPGQSRGIVGAGGDGDATNVVVRG